MGILDITNAELQAILGSNPAAGAGIKALLNIRQALFDILGAFPQDNVLPYFYSFHNTSAAGNAISANGSIQNSIKISADAAFIAMSVRGMSTGDYTAFMRMDASDRQLMNEAVVSGAFMGTAERPGPLHKPLLLPANTTVSFDITDISGSTNELYLTLAGFKVYNRKIQ